MPGSRELQFTSEAAAALFRSQATEEAELEQNRADAAASRQRWSSTH